MAKFVDINSLKEKNILDGNGTESISLHGLIAHFIQGVGYGSVSVSL